MVNKEKQFPTTQSEINLIKEYPGDHKSDSSLLDSAQEVSSRMMLLKKMGRENKNLSKAKAEQLHHFYFQLAQAPKEPWPIRIQAFRNLREMKGFSTWAEREKILQQIDKRILHLSQYSDEELLEQVIENGKID